MELTCNVTHQAMCYGVLGQPLYLHLTSLSGYEFVMKKESHKGESGVFRVKKGKINFYIQYSSFQQRWSFSAYNGTMIINPVKTDDAGAYRLQLTHGGTGEQQENYQVHLIVIKGNISNVLLKCRIN